jgi:hypothetical protein
MVVAGRRGDDGVKPCMPANAPRHARNLTMRPSLSRQRPGDKIARRLLTRCRWRVSLKSASLGSQKVEKCPLLVNHGPTMTSGHSTPRIICPPLDVSFIWDRSGLAFHLQEGLVGFAPIASADRLLPRSSQTCAPGRRREPNACWPSPL